MAERHRLAVGAAQAAGADAEVAARAASTSQVRVRRSQAVGQDAPVVARRDPAEAREVLHAVAVVVEDAGVVGRAGDDVMDEAPPHP